MGVRDARGQSFARALLLQFSSQHLKAPIECKSKHDGTREAVRAVRRALLHELEKPFSFLHELSGEPDRYLDLVRHAVDVLESQQGCKWV